MLCYVTRTCPNLATYTITRTDDRPYIWEIPSCATHLAKAIAEGTDASSKLAEHDYFKVQVQHVESIGSANESVR